jgi:hypothetical protein
MKGGRPVQVLNTGTNKSDVKPIIKTKFLSLFDDLVDKCWSVFTGVMLPFNVKPIPINKFVSQRASQKKTNLGLVTEHVKYRCFNPRLPPFLTLKK